MFEIDMDVNIDLVNLECVGIKREKHFLENPVLLQCGHFMCWSCVHKEKINEDTVHCGVCKKTKTVNFEMNPATILMRKQIEACLDKLFVVVQQDFESTLNELNYNYQEKKDFIEAQFEFQKEEIEIRAESLKNEIDELCKPIYSDLQVQKERNLKEVNAIFSEVRKFEKGVEDNKVNYAINKTKDMQMLDFISLQNDLNMLKQLNQKLLNENNKIQSTISKRCIDMELMTYLDYHDKSKKHLIIPTKFSQTISIDAIVFELCMTVGDQLVIADYIQKRILLFNKDIQLVKIVKKINRCTFHPFALASNGIDRIFINDAETKQILMTDFEFDVLGTFESNDIINPTGLCYSNDLLYICDFEGKSIHIIEQDLKTKTTFGLDYRPWYIQVIDNVACIRHCTEKSISFYKLPEFNLKYRYDGHNGFICIAESKFYEFYQPIPTIYCYNSDGTIFCKQKIVLPDEKKLSIHDSIIYFQDKFFLSCHESGKLIIP